MNLLRGKLMKYIDYNMLFTKMNTGISANIPLDYDSSNYAVTGCGILEFDESDMSDKRLIKMQDDYKMRFFSDKFKPEINIYCVPYMKLFASDGNGFFAIKINFFDGNEFYNGKVYYLTNDKKAFYICESIYKFINEFGNDNFDEENLILDDEIKLFSSYSQATEALNDYFILRK